MRVCRHCHDSGESRTASIRGVLPSSSPQQQKKKHIFDVFLCSSISIFLSFYISISLSLSLSLFSISIKHSLYLSLYVYSFTSFFSLSLYLKNLFLCFSVYLSSLTLPLKLIQFELNFFMNHFSYMQTCKNTTWDTFFEKQRTNVTSKPDIECVNTYIRSWNFLIEDATFSMKRNIDFGAFHWLFQQKSSLNFEVIIKVDFPE